MDDQLKNAIISGEAKKHDDAPSGTDEFQNSIKKSDALEISSEEASEQKAKKDNAEVNASDSPEVEAAQKPEVSAKLSEALARIGKYYQTDGRKFFHPDKHNTLAFVMDKDSLRTNENSKQTVESMVSLANAKGWKSIDVEGDKHFRREAWMQASAVGIQVSGYRPTQQDMLELEARKNELAQATFERAGESVKKAPASPVSDDQKVSLTGEDGREQVVTGAELDKLMAGQDRSIESEPDNKRLDGIHTGTLIEHGEARYNFDKDNTKSYYVKYADQNGDEKLVWGVDLKRGMDESKAQAGDKLEMVYIGREPVTVETPVKNEQGEVVGFEKINTHRNTWDVRAEKQQIQQPTFDQKIADFKNDFDKNGYPKGAKNENQALLIVGTQYAKENLNGENQKQFLEHLAQLTQAKVVTAPPQQSPNQPELELSRSASR